MDIGLQENTEETLDNDWGLGHGEEWIPNDVWDVEEVMAYAAHTNCGLECPVVVRAVMAQRMWELEDEIVKEVVEATKETENR
ncbi:hypothetical protein SUGI_0134420 [Cryptomeria japonica]|nr:hypothetical protein SUGI_0134420 [Cryptomeria japonica]